MADLSKRDLAAQVVLNFDAGMVGHYGLVPGAAAQAAVPVVVAGIDWFAQVIGRRRLENEVDVITDAADSYEAETGGDFAEFIAAAVSDPEHQELLARALTIGQDTAMRNKRRALGRAVASAANDRGTKVDDELLFIRVLADLDAPHIRLLAIMVDSPPDLDAINRKRIAKGEDLNRIWRPSDIEAHDPGLHRLPAPACPGSSPAHQR